MIRDTAVRPRATDDGKAKSPKEARGYVVFFHDNERWFYADGCEFIVRVAAGSHVTIPIRGLVAALARRGLCRLPKNGPRARRKE